MTVDATFEESTAQLVTEKVPVSHLSIEVGHLYMDDFAGGPPRLDRHFRAVAPWLSAARAALAGSLPAGTSPRISTCFLIDDYFTRFSSPAVVIPQLLQAAAAHGIDIDYIARESACAGTADGQVAAIVESAIVADPPPRSTGVRPLAREIGWLCNGERSPAAPAAMSAAMGRFVPPRENGRNRHSIFLDVELWDEADDRRTWSCPFLAAVWQLLRLGLLRDHGRAVLPPVQLPEQLPADWDDLPAIGQVRRSARPFAAYRTFSVLAPRFLPIEHAVRTILSQVAVNPAALEQLTDRAAQESVVLPAESVERIEYLFAGG